MSNFLGASIKALPPLALLEAAGSTNKNTHLISLCELSPTSPSEVCVNCEKSNLGLSEILIVST
jgi:hypothetical protein